ncbi:MAG: sigma-70 family RNA polymerase sigma factor [Cephaloticoccus sp.]|nr:sigma-70 family RNA polymerase sigma factor [Cephaloticoccus sp.]
MPLNKHIPDNRRMEATSPDESWKDWFQHYGPKLLLCARQWTRSQADAEDVVQEAFVRFWRHQRHLGGDPRALLVTSIRRAAIDLARSDVRRARREEESAGDAERLFVSVPDADDRTQVIENALRRLPDEQREVLTLKIWGEMTFYEIGNELDIPLNTAASRYRYALAALRSAMTIADCHG